MRFTTAFFAAALAATAMAATETTVDTPTTTASLDPVQSSIIACNNRCDDGDVACKAKCNPVPNPSEKQVEDTHNCIADCPQGKGTEADQKKYSDCTAQCILENYYNANNGGTPGSDSSDDSNSDSDNASATGDETSTATDASSTDDSSDSEDATGTDSESSGTATDSGSSSEETDSAGAALLGSSAALFGAVVAALAL